MVYYVPLRRSIYFMMCVAVFNALPSFSMAQGAYGLSPPPPTAPPVIHGSPQRGTHDIHPPPSIVRKAPRRNRYRQPYSSYSPAPPPPPGAYPPPSPYYPPPYYNNGVSVPYYSSPGTTYPPAPPSRSCVDGVCTGE